MPEFISNYYQDNRAWIKFILRWFLVAVIVGGVAVFIKPDLINQIINLFQSKFGSEPTRNIDLVKEIFTQNLSASLLVLFGGIILGLAPFIVVFFNGFIIGFVVVSLFFVPGGFGHNLLDAVLGLAPHGIFELPAFWLSAALGLRLGIEWLSSSSQGRRLQVLWANIVRSIRAVPVIVILLGIAAFVEVFVSGQFVGK